MNNQQQQNQENKFLSRKWALATGVVAVSTCMLNLGKLASQDYCNMNNVAVTSYMAGNVFTDFPVALGQMVEKFQNKNQPPPPKKNWFQ